MLKDDEAAEVLRRLLQKRGVAGFVRIQPPLKCSKTTKPQKSHDVCYDSAEVLRRLLRDVGRLGLVFADHDASVVAAETEAVAHGNFDGSGFRFIGRVIQIAFGIGCFQVDRGGKDFRFD